MYLLCLSRISPSSSIYHHHKHHQLIILNLTSCAKLLRTSGGARFNCTCCTVHTHETAHTHTTVSHLVSIHHHVIIISRSSSDLPTSIKAWASDDGIRTLDGSNDCKPISRAWAARRWSSGEASTNEITWVWMDMYVYMYVCMHVVINCRGLAYHPPKTSSSSSFSNLLLDLLAHSLTYWPLWQKLWQLLDWHYLSPFLQSNQSIG